MKSIEFRISDAYYKTASCVGKYPTRVFLGKQEMALLREFSERAFLSLIKRGTIPNQKPPMIGSIMGMTIHETSDETLIATGWEINDKENEGE